MSTGTPVFPHLDLVRGFAAFSVFVYHVIELYGWPDFPLAFGMWWFRVGWLGVDIFFVLSGLVIAHSLLQLQARTPQFKPLARMFLIRRAARILPLYYLTCTVFVLLLRPELLNPPSWLHLGTHLFLVHNLKNSTFGSINGVNWSVGVEVQFYLLLLLLLPLWRRMKPLTVIATGVALAWGCRALVWHLAHARDWPQDKMVHATQQALSMADEFAFGVALALLAHQGLLRWPGWKRGALFALATLAVAMLCFTIYWDNAIYWDNPWMVIGWRSLLALVIFMTLALLLTLPLKLEQFPLYRAASYLGVISYGIYLWHLPVILLLKPYITDQPLVFLLCSGACVFTLASASWHLFEQPFICAARCRSAIDHHGPAR